jgi:hypothetical protein
MPVTIAARSNVSCVFARMDCGFESHSRHGCFVYVCIYSVLVLSSVYVEALRRADHSSRESYPLWKMITELNKRPGPEWVGRDIEWNILSVLELRILNVQTGGKDCTERPSGDSTICTYNQDGTEERAVLLVPESEVGSDWLRGSGNHLL